MEVAALFVLFSPPFLPQAQPSERAFRSELNWYSETSHSRRNENTVNFTRINLHLPLPLEGMKAGPYVGMGVNQDARTSENAIYNDNNVFGTLGFKADLNPLFSLLVEYREVFSNNPHRDRFSPSEGDFRGGGLFYLFRDFPLKFSNALSLFNEHYAEIIYSSRSENNIIGFGKSQLGLRYPFTPSILLDQYLELSIKKDRLGHFYENLQELSLGLRPLWRFSRFSTSLSLQIAYALGFYDGREYKETNPYSKNYQEWKALLVFNGELSP